MKKCDCAAIKSYLEDNPLEIDPKRFSDNTLMCWFLSLLMLGSFYDRFLSFICIAVWILLNVIVTVLFSRLKINSHSVISHYLCQGIATLHWATVFQTSAYLFFTDIHNPSMESKLFFVFCFITFIILALLNEHHKIYYLKTPKKRNKLPMTFFVVFSVFGILIGKFWGRVLTYDATLSMASVVGVCLSFVLVFFVSIRYLIKACLLFIIASK